MERTVFKSLDKPHSFFHIKGRFITWMIGGVVASMFVGFVVGMVTAGLLGFFVFVLLGGCVYIGVWRLQDKMHERQLDKMMTAARFKNTYVRVAPRQFRRIVS